MSGDRVMLDDKSVQNGFGLTEQATLALLAILEEEQQITQRSLAVRVGVALGLTNALIKRAIRKGLIKVSQAPAKRFAYYLTPKGFKEKRRLTAEYLSSSLIFFRQAREEFSDLYRQIQMRKRKDSQHKVVLFGIGELAEIAFMSAQYSDVEVLGVVHLESNLSHYSGLPVINSWDAAKALDVDAVVITDSDSPQEAYEILSEIFENERIFTVPLLHVSRAVNGEGGI